MKKISIRTISQIIIVGIVLFLAFTHQQYGIEQASPIHAYCPFGALEGALTYIFSGEFLTKTYRSNYILLAIFVLLTIFFGRVFCGFFCPLGAISERLRALGKKLGIKKDVELPDTLDKYMRYVKYLVLLIIIYFSFRYTALVFDAYDPFSAFAHLGNEFDELIFAYSVLGFVVITALFSKGRRCRYFCPLGAFFALVKKLGFFKLKRDNNTCISCGICRKSCPANLKIKTADQITHPDCISCMECVNDCPKNSLDVYILGKKIKKQTFLWVVTGIFFITLSIVIWTPLWKTKPVSNIISDQGIIKVENIRGSNTLQYVIDTTKVPLTYFQEKLQLPVDIDTTMKLKEIGTTYDIKNLSGEIIETEDFRIAIDQYEEKKDNQEVTCPFGEVNCEFPGECGAYTDQDKNQICDYSE
ncbi:4Fe-4S binding protein [candidate division SR1 bacterium RAAC1_SR1_1]|nr:4Fe-4S binding protein [candidate division SR1 bacterium RAAC1_SR1_1]